MKMNQFIKKVMAFVLVFAMIAPMMGNLEINTKEVQAAEAEESIVKDKEIGYVIVPKTSVDTTGSQPAVAAGYESDKYADYLFAGWFSDEDAMTAATSDAEKLYARFVPADVLSTKCQVTTGLVTDTSIDQYRNRYVLRFVSSIDSLDYRHVGFEISYKDGEETVTKTNKTNTVFERIESTTGSTAVEKDTYSFSPKVMSTKSEYFITAKWPVADTAADKTKDYTVRAFWMTKDGTKVYGESRTVCVNDGLTATDSINLTVTNTENVSVAVGNTLAVTEDANLTATVIEFDSSTVQVRISGVNKATMKSATKFTLTKDGTTVGSEIYRNLYTKYTGSGTADTSWYEVYYLPDKTQKEFTIATSADLYGLAALTNSTSNQLGQYQTFEGMTIYLTSDIVVNDEILVTEPADANYKKWYSPSTGTYNSAPKYQDWNSISITDTNYRFKGCFDGQMHSISGIYANKTAQMTGLFARTQNATFKNLRVVNSYFKNTNTITSSVATRSWGSTFENIYSNAIIDVSNHWSGGIVAYSNGITMRNCWFDGAVINAQTAKPSGGTGGLIGSAYELSTILENCLNTGYISHKAASGNYSRTAGLVGDNGVGSVMQFNNCLNAGTVTAATGAASLVGVINAGSLTTTNTYAAQGPNVVGYMQGNGTFLVKYPGGESDKTVSSKGVQNVEIVTYWQSPSSFLGEKAKTAMGGVDFDTIWTTVANETPILRVFESQTIDTSWYNEKEDTYVLYDRADLRGFSKLSKETDFAGKTIKLGNDIVVNTGDEANWTTTAPKYAWTPISSDTLPFAGTFDGGMHTIRGLYMNTTSSYSGLFASTAAASVIKNLKIEDSYFTSTGMYLGSIAGSGSGKIENVYSNAIVTGTNAGVGGLLGRTAEFTDLKYCWYAGTATNTATGSESTDRRGTGGLVGLAYGTVNIDNCLNSGSIDSQTSTKAYPKTGGLIGGVEAGAKVTLTDSLSSGTISVGSSSTGANIAGCISDGQLLCTTSYGYGVKNSVAYAQGSYKFIVNYMEGSVMKQSSYTGTGVKEAPVMSNWNNASSFTGTAAKSYMKGIDFTNTWQTVEGAAPILALSADLENMDKRWYDASATEYVLYDKGDLYGFSELAKTTDFTGKTVKLGNDIVLHEGNAAKWGTNPFLNDSDMWTPIGSTSKPFAGTFDGGLYTISGLYMNATVANSGLFGETTVDSVIENVRLENSYLTSTASGLGSIVGKSRGTIEKVYSNAILNAAVNNMGGIVGSTAGDNTTIQYAWFEGTVTNTGTGTRASGGIIGATSGTVYLENCLSEGTIDGSKYTSTVAKVGGVVGGVESGADIRMTDILSLSNVKGKYAGVMIGCIDAANVRCTTSYAKGTGAVDYIVGWMQNSSKFIVDCIDGTTLYENLDRSVNYKNNDYLTDVANAHRSIKLMWLDKNDQSSYSGEKAVTKLKGFNFDGAWKTVENDTPILNFDDSAYEAVDTRWYDETTSEYVLYDEGDLYGFAELSVTKSFKGKTIKLGKDIVVNEGKAADWATNAPERSWVPIGYKYSGGDTYTAFNGTFDGQGHTISGLYFDRTQRYAGLFACVGTNGVVKNVKLTNSYFESTARDLGSIAGRGDGKFYMIHSDAIVKGTYSMGGIIGLTYGAELGNCWFKGSIINTSTGSGDLNTGGIVGFAYGDTASTLTLRNCLNTANIDASAGTKTLPFVGGIIGLILPNSKLTVEIDSCLNTGTISENAAVTGGVGAIVGYCNTDPNAAVIYRTYAIQSTSGNNIIRDGLFVVDAESIKGASAETNMPYLEWGKYWECGAEGQYPELKFTTEGYGTGISATKGEQDLLAELYKDRALYQGELHAHAQTLGKGDDGKTALQTWLDEQIADNKLSFAASLDHHQYSHFTDTKLGWQKSQLIYGTEAGTTITNRFDTSLTGELHYNMLFPSNVGLEAIISDFSEFTDMSKMSFENAASYWANKEKYQFGYPDFTRERFVELIEAVRANGGFFVHAHPTQTTYAPATSLADYYFAPNVGFEVLYMNSPQLEKELAGTDNKWTAEQEARYQEYGAYVTTESATHYSVWNQLLNAKKRLYATAGSDTHRDLNTYAVTSVYSNQAKADVDKGEIINQLRDGDFVAGAVGIQMSVQTGSGQIHMGGEADFNGNRLVVNIGDFHESVVRVGHKYRVDIYDNNGLVVRKMITPGHKMNLALTTTTHSGYYRVEVYDMTLGCPIAIGNPIWNQDWK